MPAPRIRSSSPRVSREMRRSRLVVWAAWAGGAIGVGAVLACGPSYQALYEGDARFEHCFAVEESGATTMAQKRDCWRDWTGRYTYGQTRDRIEYATARYRALSLAPRAPTDEAMMEAAPGEGRSSNIAAPAPTSAFEPPPTMLADMDAGVVTPLPGYGDAGTASSAFPPSAGAALPDSVCLGECDSSWNTCKSRCLGAACEKCTRDYKKCGRGCFSN